VDTYEHGNEICLIEGQLLKKDTAEFILLDQDFSCFKSPDYSYSKQNMQ
jgi:hypothetical protein